MTEQPSDKPLFNRDQQQGQFWAEAGLCAVVMVAVFALADRFVLPRLEPFLIAGQTADIQEPASFFAKLDFLRRHPGHRVGLVGDSVILGLCLREHGDPNWQAHGPTALLRRQVEAIVDEPNVRVVNLGLNGALPADLAEVARLLAPVQPNLIVADIGLRGFSEDFASSGTSLSRPWLARMEMTPDGTCQMAPSKPGALARWQAAADSWLTTHWQLYRLRELAQQAIHDGEPQTLRGRVHALLGSRPHSDGANRELMDLQLLMKAQARYQTANLRASHPQRLGLECFLNRARDQGWATLLVYARENPLVRGDLMEESRYQSLNRELAALLQPYQTRRLQFHPGIETISPSHYLDHVHLDAEGYREWFLSLEPSIRDLLAR
jgi:hypothetical protein